MASTTKNKQKNTNYSEETPELTVVQLVDSMIERKLNLIKGFSAAEFKYFLNNQAVTSRMIAEKTGKARDYVSQVPRMYEEQKRDIPFWFMEALIEVMGEMKFKLLRKMYQRSKK